MSVTNTVTLYDFSLNIADIQYFQANLTHLVVTYPLSLNKSLL